MQKWGSVMIRQELLEEVKKAMEKRRYKSLSDFVSEAIQFRLQKLAEERIPEYLERDRSAKLMLQGKLFYTPKHVWAQATPQGRVKVGITGYFQSRLKEIVNIQTYGVGENVFKDEPFGVVETWWSTYDLYSPLNGEIVSLNRKVIDDPFELNVDPSQWILEVQPKHGEADSWMNGLLSFEEYKKLITKLEGRL